MTLPHASVVSYVDRHLVAVRLESARHADLARGFNVRWLPGLVIAGGDGRPAHVSVGFLPPGDLVDEIAFGRAIAAMGEKRYDDAHRLFAGLADGDAARSAEACFWWGISRYRQSKQFTESVREPWGKILERWPGSQWARKVGYALGRPPV